MKQRCRVLIVGCGRMGSSHAHAYHRMRDDFEIVGLVSRGEGSRARLDARLGGGHAQFSDYGEALRKTQPDAVCISTYPDTHAAYAIQALEAGAHVFLEKPIAGTLEDAQRVVDVARRCRRKLVVGYILQVHPSWQRFVEVARTMGRPLVMRMNLNQQLSALPWALHRNLLSAVSPLIDCGVHYVEVMCRMTQARPVRVHAIAARLSDEIAPGQVNYAQLQVTFADQSVGWYEVGWGPMASETAFFVKDVWGPAGSVSIVARRAASAGASSDIDAHTRTESLLVHHAQLREDGSFARANEWIDLADEPDHDELCRREQLLFLQALREDVDLDAHLNGALDSLRVVLAAQRSHREGHSIEL